MLFLPSTCDHCPTIALVSCADRLRGHDWCAECGGTLTFLPVPAYPQSDVLLFNELMALSKASGLAGVAAEQLAKDVERARTSCNEQEALNVAALRLPELWPLVPLLVASPGSARQALSMLDAILRSLSRGANVSRQRRARSAEQAPADWQVVGAHSRMWRDTDRDD